MRHPTTTAVSTVALIAVFAGGCTAADDPGGGPEADVDVDAERPFALPDDLELAASLDGFDACDGFLDHVTEAALDEVTPWGLGHGWRGGMEGEMAVDEQAAADTGADVDDGGGAAPAAEPLEEGVDYSGTNVQEVGVDEPDRVKTDGDTMYLVTENRLRILDITGDDPVELAALDLEAGWDAQLLLDGDRLLLSSSVYGAIPFAGERLDTTMPTGGAVSTLTLIDVADPTAPRVAERLSVDGSTLSSRMVDGVARIVVRTEQGMFLPWAQPEGSGLRAERRALDANRQIIRDSAAEDWIPYLLHEDADGRETEGALLDCERIARPEQYAGLGVLSVLTVDLDDGGLLPGDEAVGILAGGDTVYASTERLYVATTRWVDWGGLDDTSRRREADRTTTEIHSFDIADAATTEYLASGEVPGHLLSQWAMSEYEGRLRVASTVGEPWGWQTGGPSESFVSILERDGPELVVVGQVDGLGLTERIYAVRFIGDVGYVVTFRETDPLYTLDLSDPTRPAVTGELEIMGYSAYLHPVGEGLLLGVGQDADERGMTKGTQLSLFDVSDPADPRRLDQVTLADGSSEVEYDHRAFLHWPATGLTVVPFQRWAFDERTGREDVESGALSFTVDAVDGIVESATLTHLPQLRREAERLRESSGTGEPTEPGDLMVEDRMYEWGWQAAITRSIVRGERLLTLSSAGLATHDLDTLEDTGWHRFES